MTEPNGNIDRLQNDLNYMRGRMQHQEELLKQVQKTMDELELRLSGYPPLEAPVNIKTQLDEAAERKRQIQREIAQKKQNIEGIMGKIRQYSQGTPPALDVPTREQGRRVLRVPIPAEEDEEEEQARPVSRDHGDYRVGRQGERARERMLAFPIVAALLLGGLILADVLFFWNWMWSPAVGEIYLDEGFHHLGDNTYNEEYIQSIEGDMLNKLDAEGTQYLTAFSLRDLRERMNLPLDTAITRAEVFVTVNHLKPRQNAPVILVINDSFQDFLNNHIEREQFRREKITLPVDPQDFLEGQNTLVIATGQDSEEDDLEDFEFNDLGLRLWTDEQRLHPWKALGALAVNIVVLIGAIVLFFSAFGLFRSRNRYDERSR